MSFQRSRSGSGLDFVSYRVIELCVSVCVCVREGARWTPAPSRQRGTNKEVTETGHLKDGLKMRKKFRLAKKSGVKK